MNKKDYQKPAMRVVLLQHQAQLLVGSGTFTTISTNLEGEDDIEFGGGGDGTSIKAPR